LKIHLFSDGITTIEGIGISQVLIVNIALNMYMIANVYLLPLHRYPNNTIPLELKYSG